jgi:hypothetical protein
MSEMVDLLREILIVHREQLSVQRETLAVQRRQAAAEPLADRLLRAVHGLLEGATFTAPMLLELATSPLSTRRELHAVVEDIVRGGIEQAGAGRSLGRFLASNARHRAGVLILVSLGKTRAGGAYRIDVATKTRDVWNAGIG